MGSRAEPWAEPDLPGGCKLVRLPQITDARGDLTAIEGMRHVPFAIRRVYYLYDVPQGAERGGHAHRELEQLLIAVAGSFNVVVDDGTVRTRVHLNRAYMGLLMSPMVWHEMDDFSSGAVCLVLASAPYDAGDYIRDYDEFRDEFRCVVSSGWGKSEE